MCSQREVVGRCLAPDANVAGAAGQKGVDKNVIDEALKQLDGEKELSGLVEKLRRKIPVTKHSTEYELRGKLLRYALSLGFDYDMAIEAVDAAVDATN